MSDKKILGIIGGMGPEATVLMFSKIVAMCNAENDQEHVEMLIHNNTNIPDRTKAILYGGQSPLGELSRSANALVAMGAGVLIIPCMTSHFFLKELQEKVPVPIINAIEQSVCHITSCFKGLKSVGVLATTGTLKAQLFQQGIESAGCKPIMLPDDLQEEWVMAAIYGKRGIKAGYKGDEVRQKLVMAGDFLISQGVEAIIAGCTEIPLVVSQDDFAVPLIDPMDTLARKAIEVCMGRVR